ncbi:hypothetical protein [Streptomyces sp. NBC_00878]|uniref:hypothetical protein n=1 Tax=Streptomyces sp. NBC_00878 TaxID=2975854 RepID=UPI00225938E8|nr:hypothetical protein [Streptomyces sp. NBC_00878]MCX4907631.1 hypothetical protein [Streptomyces sp. NBC_00878]
MADKELAIRSLVQLADHVHWVREWPDRPTWRNRLRQYVWPLSWARASLPMGARCY